MASWIITPFLPPPPTSEIRFHHPDFYTVLQAVQRNVDNQFQGMSASHLYKTDLIAIYV